MNARAKITAALEAQWPRRNVEAVSVDLPLPISTNDLWAPDGKGGLRETERYRTWKREAANRIALQKPGSVRGAYELTLLVSDRRRKVDLSNTIKAAEDSLQTARIIDNDRNAERVVIEWSSSIEGARAIITKWQGRAA